METFPRMKAPHEKALVQQTPRLSAQGPSERSWAFSQSASRRQTPGRAETVEAQGTAEKILGRVMFGVKRFVKFSPGKEGRDRLRGLLRSTSPIPGMVRCPTLFCPKTPPTKRETKVKVKTVSFMMVRRRERSEYGKDVDSDERWDNG